MNLSFFIAKRYFKSKKKRNFINVISRISMVGVAIGTMALVIALSVMNGLKENIRSLYGAFDPQLKIIATTGKSFEVNQELLQSIASVDGISSVTEVVEDNALIEYQENSLIVKVKGVGDNFFTQNLLSEHIVDGELKLKKEGINYTVLGRATQRALSVQLENDYRYIKIYYPKDIRIGNIDPSQSFVTKNIRPGAVFALEQQYTEEHIFVPLEFAVDLFGFGDKRTSIEVKAISKDKIPVVQQNLKNLLGGEFQILNGDEQHASLVRAIRIEKLFVFLVFSSILAAVSFNTFFALTMLGIEKKKDVAVLYSLGASRSLIRGIFLSEGAIIAFSGAIFGLLMGMTLLILQQEYGLVSLGMESAVLEAYPVKMEFLDFLFSSLTIVVITFLASYRPAWMTSKIKIGEYL